MTSFDEREKGFERKYAHDEEVNFKIIARRNKLLGLWAAEKLGKQSAAAEHYATEIIAVYLDHSDHHAMFEKLIADFKQAGIALAENTIHEEMERLLPIAREQMIGSKN